MPTVEVDEELKDILPNFLENRKKDIIDLKAALSAKNYGAIEKIGHRVSGSSGGYGFGELGTIAKQIELDCKSGKYDNIEVLINQFEDFMNNLDIKFI